MFSLGPLQINWYGFFISLGMLIALFLILKIGEKRKIKKEILLDLFFWAIVFGVFGARLYDVILELPFYLKNPGQIIKIWEGGLAIHGGIIAGLLVLIFFAKKFSISFWKLGAITVPGLALAQAIGRFGNYFNQELFGLPTKLPWGIPISQINRPLEFINETYFHPTFIYEGLGSLIIFLVLIFITYKQLKSGEEKKHSFDILLVTLYMLLYSILRFGLEFIRIDYSPILFGLRTPQVISLLMALVAIFIMIKNYVAQKKERL
ncbi:prolipoprotein diacylglyceryl transferase [Patescibacteria group bacterium]|nr:prolipoprotein diacylglyceryl transferase [Patescibacteria group bacterium]